MINLGISNKKRYNNNENIKFNRLTAIHLFDILYIVGEI